MSKATDDYSQNISVFVRVRPTLPLEGSSRSVLECVSDREITVKENVKARHNERVSKTYGFNRVFGPNSSQVDVYRHVVGPLLDEVLGGYSCTVFAYGQTGTGKTFTMEGDPATDSNFSRGSDPNAGIIPRTLSALFERLRLSNAISYAVRVSFLELYNEELIDLLSANDDNTKLRLFEDSTKKGAVIISGLEEVEVCSKGDVYKILEKGAIKRQTASTLMNAHSSRSHTVFTATIYIREDATNEDGQEVLRTGKINLVDLAGSENIGRSGAIEKRAREAGNINQSLLTLGRVITALVEHSPHVPYRESKLTRLLQESLGGRTKTSIIATVSPALCNLEETLSTLDYAHRAKNIQNKPEVNQRFNKKTLLTEYTGEIERLHRDLEASRQRKGVYLDQNEYDDLIRTLDALDEEGEDKTEHIKALTAEHTRLTTVCDDLNAKVEGVVAVLVKNKSCLEEKLSSLSELKSDVEKTRWTEREQTHLVAKHWETAEVLKSQAEELMNVAEQVAVKPLQLLDKLDRVRSVAKTNEETGAELQKKIKQSIDAAIDMVKTCVTENENKISEIKSRLNEHSEGVMGKLKTRLDEVKIGCEDELKLIEEAQRYASESATREDLWCSEHRDLVGEQAEGSVKLIDWMKICHSVLKKLSEQTVKLGAEINENVVESIDLDTWRCESLKQSFINDAAYTFSELKGNHLPVFHEKRHHVERAESVLADVKSKQHEFYEISKKKLSYIYKLLADLQDLDREWQKASSEARTTMNGVVSDYKADAESVKSSINAFLTQRNEEFTQNKERNVQEFKNKCNKICDGVQKWDTVDQLGDLPSSSHSRLEEAWTAWKNHNSETQNLIDKDDSARNEMTQLFRNHLKEVQDSLTKEKDGNDDKMTQISSDMQDMTENVESLISEHKEHVDAWTQLLEKTVSECSDLVSKFATEDFQRDVPTGATPQRTEINYPRNLAATSPHERILHRFRERMQEMQDSAEEKSEESSVDSDSPPLISMVDSSVSESISVNKENVDVLLRENSIKTPEKKRKARKPLLSQNARH